MSARTLTLLRHGDALPAAAGAEDYHRPLSAGGRDDIQRLLARCLDLKIDVDWIYASPAQRTQASAKPFKEAWNCTSADNPELYLADEYHLFDILRQTPPDITHVFMVGHNPGISNLAGQLSRPHNPMALPTTGLVSFTTTAEWVDLRPQCARLTFQLYPADY